MAEDLQLGRRRFRITALPRYLCLSMRRFGRNRFFAEKNPTIVNFPVRNLELRGVVPLPPGAASRYDLLSSATHDGAALAEGAWRLFVQRAAEGLWYEAQDLRIQEAMPDAVAISEAYLQVSARIAAQLPPRSIPSTPSTPQVYERQKASPGTVTVATNGQAAAGEAPAAAPTQPA